MPPAQFHFAIGAFVGFIVMLFFLPLKKKWLIYIPFIITIFGFLAMFPDIGKVASEFPLLWRTPLASPILERELQQQKYNNIFFYHGYMDRNTLYESRGDLAAVGFFTTILLYSLTSAGYIVYAKKYLKKNKKIHKK